MITDEQMKRAEAEFASESQFAFQKARNAEHSLEAATYESHRTYDPQRRRKLFEEFQDADYLAESRAWILGLMRKATKKSGVPHDAICFFRDGAKMQAVFGDFVDLQESPAGFGNNFEEALADLQCNKNKSGAA